jgi:hypothetical protein
LNRTAHRYIGHFDVSLKNRVASLRGCAAHALREDPTDYGAWINLNNYAQTNEPFGLLPFDDQTRKCVSMLPFDNSMPSKQHPNSTTRHWFLSGLQGTRFTVLPVHTRKEHTLFQSLIHSSPLFANTQQPDFVAIASMSNSHANSIDIFYKVSPSHRTSTQIAQLGLVLTDLLSLPSYPNTSRLTTRHGLITSMKKPPSRSALTSQDESATSWQLRAPQSPF